MGAILSAEPADTAPALLAAIAHGMDLVMANTVPLASELSVSRAILDGAKANGRRVLHEATVGAGLPVAARVGRSRGRRGQLLWGLDVARKGLILGRMLGAPIGSALASLDGTDNLFVFATVRYRDRPLVISGPGAGAQVTAAGVLGDILPLAAA